jgi:hypothetical protein
MIALLLAALATLPPGIVLDADADRVLIGTPLPAPPNSDVPLRMTVRLIVRGAEKKWPAGTVASARLLSHGRLLGVSPEGDLTVWDHGRPTVVDHGVIGAVGASADGRHLVYCKGVPPDLEVWRADDGHPRAVTKDMAPTWSPAVEGDGSTVIFVSAKTGVPALWRVDRDGAPRQITNRDVKTTPGQAPVLTPFPDSMTAPLLFGGLFVFESTGTVHVFWADGRPVKSLPGASPYWTVPGKMLGVFRDGQRVEVVAP